MPIRSPDGGPLGAICGAAPGVVPKLLMGIPGLLPGPLRPFAGVTVGGDGKVYVAADGDGSIVALSCG